MTMHQPRLLEGVEKGLAKKARTRDHRSAQKNATSATSGPSCTNTRNAKKASEEEMPRRCCTTSMCAVEDTGMNSVRPSITPNRSDCSRVMFAPEIEDGPLGLSRDVGGGVQAGADGVSLPLLQPNRHSAGEGAVLDG